MERVAALRDIVGEDYAIAQRDLIQACLMDKTPQAVKPVPVEAVIGCAHAIDGHFHPHLRMDLQRRGLLWKVKDEICEAGIRLGGTATAEHRVGRSRHTYLDRYTDEMSKRLMRGIRLLFNPVASSTSTQPSCGPFHSND